MNYCNNCKYYISHMNCCKLTRDKRANGQSYYMDVEIIRGYKRPCKEYRRKWYKFWVKEK
jgi:hypothetical protein